MQCIRIAVEYDNHAALSDMARFRRRRGRDATHCGKRDDVVGGLVRQTGMDATAA
jgi:hypothetical protein